jgi:hypothetical protein
MSLQTQRLLDWSQGVDTTSLTTTVQAAVEFVGWTESERELEVHAFADRHCLPNFELGPASGLYVLLRVVFDLPAQHPRDDTKVFGGWLHPSINDGQPMFDLSWPVRIEAGSIRVEPFSGYFGKGYDAVGEYRWFASAFKMRGSQLLDGLVPVT